ncbi:MAG: hypothetical protein IT368_15070 [Candidatus Hydrogenedentes bacterium]|nr:hypothetical protein [Candidatus Hydrogenedentota bacterium]
MAATRKPSIRFYHSKALRNKTLKVLDAIDKDKDPTAHKGAFADLVVELSDIGMNYWFIQPLELAKMNIMVRQSARVGTASANRIVAPIVRGVVGRMDGRQLRTVAKFLRKHLD